MEEGQGGRENGGREAKRREQRWLRRKNRTFKDFRDIFWPQPTRHKYI